MCSSDLFEYSVDSLMPGGYNNQRWQNGVVGQLENGNWEVTEPRGSGLIDTMSDLICNFVGTLCFLVPVLVLFVKKPSRAGLFALERRQNARKKPAPHPRNGNKRQNFCGAASHPRSCANFFATPSSSLLPMTAVARSFKEGTAFATA